MGKANAPLPDPLSSPSPSTVAGADDLLSQLAGDEIDRLLAEAEVEAPSLPQAQDVDSAIASAAVDIPGLANPDSSAAPETTDAAKDAMRLLDDVQKNADAIEQDVAGLAPAAPLSVSPAPTAVTETPSAIDVPDATETKSDAPAAAPSINSDLDDLFKQLNERPTPAAPPVDESPTAEPPEPAAEVPTTPRDDGIAAEAKTAASERAGLGLADLATSYASAASPASKHGDDESRLPLLLRPLEWLSAPLDAAPDTVRDVMGKAAIVTFVNAAAVILYVLIFRK